MQEYDLVALRAFVAVVEAGSFYGAAEQVDASTAAVSRRVSGLEDALGVKLLHRTTRQIDLTEAGKHFYEDVLNVINSLAEAEERIRTGRETVTGNLRVAAPSSFGVQRIGPILPGFMARHPKLSVQIKLEDRFIDLIAEGVDVAIRIGTLQDSSLIATRIADVSRVCCASPDYLSRCGEPREPSELEAHDCLQYSLLSARKEWSFPDGKETIDVAVSGPLSANNGEVLKEAAVQGMGIALLPDFIVEEALSDGRLVAILPQFPPKPFGLYAVRPSRRFVSARVQRFIAYLKTQLAGDALPVNAKI